MSQPKDSINNKIDDLKKQIDWFYSEDFSLDRAADKYQKSVDLAKEIEKDLSELKNTIELIGRDFTKE